jgi:hypothetical protein
MLEMLHLPLDIKRPVREVAPQYHFSTIVSLNLTSARR